MLTHVRARRLLRALLLWIAVPATIAAAAPIEPSTRPPNIILIVADDLGYGDLGCYGQAIIRTPRLDAMAAQGLRLTDFHAGAPVCAPSRCTLITGRHSGHAFVRDNLEVQPEGQIALPAGTVTLPGELRALGYATGATGKWGLGSPGSSGDPTKQGFDFFYGYNCQREAHNFYPTHLWRNTTKEMLEGNVKGNLVGPHYSHDLIMREAMSFLRREKDAPFFLYLPVTIPHVSLQVPEDSLAEYAGKIPDAPYDGKEGYLPHPTPHAAYAAMVSRLDRDIGHLLDLLVELHLDRTTLVIFTSDNGPTHGRVGGADSPFFHSAGSFRGLKGSVYEGGLRVPLIAWQPGTVPAGAKSDLPCVMYDLMPTLLEIGGGASKAELDGLSLAPTLTGRGTQPSHAWMYWEFPGYGGQQALRAGNLKAVRTTMHKGPMTTQLYELDQDPGESHDLAATRPDDVQRLERLMREARVASTEFPFAALDGKAPTR
jgi:arylsulfatase A